ncbi:MAG TPA: zinc ribbon domain-containing protein, partial [Methanomassiliicoccales archaeon]|nr:zinc ribbon domain-containing protein [Methanomassiliicoccales archaeon]
TKLKWAWSLTGLTLVMLAGLAVGMYLLQTEYFPIGSQYRYGPAPFLALFGIVFSLMGAVMYLINTRKAVEKKVARSGFRPRRQSEFQEMATTPKVYRGVSECPQCGEEVGDDMAICPNCSAVLTAREVDEEEDEVR